MLSQQVRPVRWVIVDDASTDNTAHIVKKESMAHPWIRYCLHPGDPVRKTGVAEVNAFNYGFTELHNVNYDFIVKLDGDVRFEKNYFNKLLLKFEENIKLGIASGVYLESALHSWKTVSMPDYHAAGASKVVRRTCFEQIGGFIPERGWDTVDEIRAISRGWVTGHFPDIKFYHLRKEGTGMGQLSTNSMHGEIFYRTGGGGGYFLVKSIIRMLHGKPFILAGTAMIYGYLNALLSRRGQLVTHQEAALYRMLLNQRFRGVLNRFSLPGS
jgi:glycosyltransferase involved in cell wall biosynthesis